ncbi:helix-turn-helix domain-containing protein [Actinophytocola algeriensis]|uniref:Transcriptional regulator with XRE-family HTH domain n=1 Tax=Actinophytocola algeriensis TaxID=1768010 RepID=A0A7W7VH76_9PSEU|nr:helix-turn-helix transcriptional regulator [Actinophytocola algeriensis]MBB4910227.1 transcriptional regulator with XRE-family HTH domain [Actinophytocola algeriensis]MBE1480784.1 transcriptional regulator with XRE-family HTH domain [Actinophytocola algeriensis]
MSRGPSPTVRRRRLAARLRELRENANLTIDEVGDKLECSASKISRIETGHVGVTPRDVRDMLEVYGVDDDEREALVQLAREARKKGWWHAYNEVFTGSFVGLESDASFLHTHQALLVPGLLQTEAYTRAVIRAIRPDSAEADVELRVRARINRQKLITEESNPPEYWAVLDEAVLHRVVGGPEAMRDQLKKLVELASLPHVTLQIVPFSSGAHAGMEAPFLILGFPEQADPDVVYVENSTSGVYLEQPEDVHRYTLMFDHLRAAALKPDDTVEMVDRTADRLS